MPTSSAIPPFAHYWVQAGTSGHLPNFDPLRPTGTSPIFKCKNGGGRLRRFQFHSHATCRDLKNRRYVRFLRYQMEFRPPRPRHPTPITGCRRVLRGTYPISTPTALAGTYPNGHMSPIFKCTQRTGTGKNGGGRDGRGGRSTEEGGWEMGVYVGGSGVTTPIYGSPKGGHPRITHWGMLTN